MLKENNPRGLSLKVFTLTYTAQNILMQLKSGHLVLQTRALPQGLHQCKDMFGSVEFVCQCGEYAMSR